MTQNLFYDLPNDLKEEIQTRSYKMVHKEFLEAFKVNVKNYYNELKIRCVTKRFNELKSRLDVLLDIPLIEHEDYHEFSNSYAKFKQLLDGKTYMINVDDDDDENEEDEVDYDEYEERNEYILKVYLFGYIEVDKRMKKYKKYIVSYLKRLEKHIGLFDYMLQGWYSKYTEEWEEIGGDRYNIYVVVDYYEQSYDEKTLYDENGKSMYDIGKCLR